MECGCGFNVTNGVAEGLSVSWPKAGMLNAPVRVALRGENLFRVWEGGDSGENPPAWSEPDLEIIFFGPETGCELYELSGAAGRRFVAEAKTGRAAVSLEISFIDDELSMELTVKNPQATGGKPFPLGGCEINLGNIAINGDTVYQGAHPYFGRDLYKGRAKDLCENARLHHGCIGLAFPLAYLYDEKMGAGLQFEFMTGERSDFSLSTERDGYVKAGLRWGTERLLQPLERHAYGGAFRIKAVGESPLRCMRKWRDEAFMRYGLAAPAVPGWAGYVSMVEFWFDDSHLQKPFRRLDDGRLADLMRSWRDKGLNTIFAVSPNRSGINPLSPINYYPDEEYGGLEAEGRFLEKAHEIGLRVILWVTTVGLDRNSKEAAEHPEWWTHRRDGSLFYAWNAGPENNYVGYAPDADPLSNGWRSYMKEQARSLIERGYDGMFIDGCIPRGSNHERVEWPGQGRDGVPLQVLDLYRFVKGLKKDFMLYVEDAALWAHTGSDIIASRYHTCAPAQRDGVAIENTRIPPESAREYILTRHACMLPDVVFNDELEGYHSERDFPWIVQSLLSGAVPKFKSGRFDYGQDVVYGQEAFLLDAPEADRAPGARVAGFERIYGLLRFVRDEPLIREQPLTVEGVEVGGDAAVVGMLKMAESRGVLTLMNFAERPAEVSVKLGYPSDAPEKYREDICRRMDGKFTVREIIGHPEADGLKIEAECSKTAPFAAQLGPYGYKIFIMERV